MTSAPPTVDVDFSTPLLFRPHLFFWKPWEGTGEARRPNGRLISTYRVEGEGHAGRRSAHMRQTITFDTGQVQKLDWEVLEDDPESYVARDTLSGVVAKGHERGAEFVWCFWTRQDSPVGRLPVKSTVTYRLETETTAVGVCVVRLFGLLPLAIMTTRYRQTA